MSTVLTAADIRKVKPFKMEDEDLLAYGEMAVTLDPFGIESSSAIPSAEKKTLLFAFLAAHLATVLREPEPTSTRFRDMTVQWSQKDTLSEDSLRESGPGKMFLTVWRKANRGWVLR